MQGRFPQLCAGAGLCTCALARQVCRAALKELQALRQKEAEVGKAEETELAPVKAGSAQNMSKEKKEKKDEGGKEKVSMLGLGAEPTSS